MLPARKAPKSALNVITGLLGTFILVGCYGDLLRDQASTQCDLPIVAQAKGEDYGTIVRWRGSPRSLWLLNQIRLAQQPNHAVLQLALVETVRLFSSDGHFDLAGDAGEVRYHVPCGEKMVEVGIERQFNLGLQS